GLIVVALNGYVLLGGADFGGGVWDLLASGPRRDSQRALIAEAIGPIWEANHVWLIIVIVLLFTCFPPAFAALSITLHIPLTLMLIGIVLRGSRFRRIFGAGRSPPPWPSSLLPASRWPWRCGARRRLLMASPHPSGHCLSTLSPVWRPWVPSARSGSAAIAWRVWPPPPRSR